MLFVLQSQYVDFEDFPIGPPSNLVGPFESKDALIEWVDSHPKFREFHGITKSTYGYSGRYKVQINIKDLTRNIPSPDDERWQ